MSEDYVCGMKCMGEVSWFFLCDGVRGVIIINSKLGKGCLIE